VSTSRATPRNRNLRQLLLRAARILNVEIVAALVARGYDLRSTHTALLSNLDEEGNMISTVAERAGMSKQAMGRIADELETLKYIASTSSATDKRARVLKFTTKGWKLMLASFEILAKIEQHYASRIGKAQLAQLCANLEVLISERHETD
jgi:DNA-binding MarR family transcriptional regulator